MSHKHMILSLTIFIKVAHLLIQAVYFALCMHTHTPKHINNWVLRQWRHCCKKNVQYRCWWNNEHVFYIFLLTTTSTYSRVARGIICARLYFCGSRENGHSRRERHFSTALRAKIIKGEPMHNLKKIHIACVAFSTHMMRTYVSSWV